MHVSPDVFLASSPEALAVTLPHWRPSAHPVSAVVELHAAPLAALPFLASLPPSLATQAPTLPASLVFFLASLQVEHEVAFSASALSLPTQSPQSAWHLQSFSATASFPSAALKQPSFGAAVAETVAVATRARSTWSFIFVSKYSKV